MQYATFLFTRLQAVLLNTAKDSTGPQRTSRKTAKEHRGPQTIFVTQQTTHVMWPFSGTLQQHLLVLERMCTVRVADRAVRRTSAPVMTLMWSTMTVPVNGATFRPDHIVFWAEHPAVPHAVIDVNDSMTTCDLNDYDRCAGGDDDVNVADNTLSMHQVSPRVMMN